MVNAQEIKQLVQRLAKAEQLDGVVHPGLAWMNTRWCTTATGIATTSSALSRAMSPAAALTTSSARTRLGCPVSICWPPSWLLRGLQRSHGRLQ
jgi:hypothetical protein